MRMASFNLGLKDVFSLFPSSLPGSPRAFNHVWRRPLIWFVFIALVFIATGWIAAGGYWDYPVSLAELVIWGVVYWAASSALDYRARRLGLSGWVRCLANFLVLSLVAGGVYLRFLGWFAGYVPWSG